MSAASRIRTVALLDIAEPTVDLALNTGRSNESHSSSYAQALTDQQIEFSPLLSEAITRRLEDSDYKVSTLADQRPVLKDDGSVDLSAVRTDADAILVVRFVRAAYVSASSDGLQPLALVEVQLFDARSHQRLYSKTFDGGYDAGAKAAVRLPTDPRFRFASVDQLMQKLDDSASGIKDAELAIASAVGRDFAVGSRPVAGYSEPEPAPPQTTAAERDRLAAAALAAQWAARTPAPAPADTDSAASSAADTTAAVEAKPSANEAGDAETSDAAPPASAAEASPVATSGPDQPTGAPPPAEPAQTTAVPEAIEAAAEPAPPVDDTMRQDKSNAEATVADSAVSGATAAVPAVPAPTAEPDTGTRSGENTLAPSAVSPVPAPSESAPVLAVAAPASASAPVVTSASEAAVAASSSADVAQPAAAPAAAAPKPVTPKLTISDSLRGGPSLVLQQRTVVRVSPTAQAGIVAVLPAGAGATADARVIRNASGSWCYIKSGTISGWVPAAAVGR
ncbi:hypothetical protein [Solimonas terrae]|uniref:SH3 domain-containing protein n=1 Tax=Solimonas terrae TaxID=1396819 RepID=A0A6M2BUJ6_9GAMM|nr:hypothetical protein [Solimonas terrae]NGY06352.1 hypothetical protein [Solimonas terrae]